VISSRFQIGVETRESIKKIEIEQKIEKEVKVETRSR
jgi:hypothetical protein